MRARKEGLGRSQLSFCRESDRICRVPTDVANRRCQPTHQAAGCWNLSSRPATCRVVEQPPPRRDRTHHTTSTRCLAQTFPLRLRLRLPPHLQRRPRERPSSHQRGSTSASTALGLSAEVNTGADTNDLVRTFQHSRPQLSRHILFNCTDHDESAKDTRKKSSSSVPFRKTSIFYRLHPSQL